jgi:hypothetical protein
MQVAAKLEVVGRIGEDDIDGVGRQLVECCDAIALDDRDGLHPVLKSEIEESAIRVF